MTHDVVLYYRYLNSACVFANQHIMKKGPFEKMGLFIYLSDQTNTTMGDATKPQTTGTIIPFEPIDKGGIYYTTDKVMTPEDREWLCEMAMKGVRVYVNHPERVDLWVSASNPDPSIVELIKNTTKIVVLASGLPPNPPKDPPH